MDTVNEATTYVVTVSFFDQDNEPVAPDVAAYRLDDESSNTVILDWTSIASPTEATDVIITSAQNTMVSANSESEVHILTVYFTYGGVASLVGTAEYRYMLINLNEYPHSIVTPRLLSVGDSIDLTDDGGIA
jgi:hypothetical protein